MLRNHLGLRCSLALAAGLALSPTATSQAQGRATPILLEAEAFEDHGGWVLDQQFMDLMLSLIHI